MDKKTWVVLVTDAVGIIVAVQSLINTNITSLTIILLIIGIILSLYIIFSKKYHSHSKYVKYISIIIILILTMLLFLVVKNFIKSNTNSSWEKPTIHFFMKSKEGNPKLLAENNIVNHKDEISIEVKASSDTYTMVLIKDSLNKSSRLQIMNNSNTLSGTRHIKARKIAYLPSPKKYWKLDNSQGLETFYVISSLTKISDEDVDSLLKIMNVKNNRAILEVTEYDTNIYTLSRIIKGEVEHFFKEITAINIFSITLKHK